MGNNEKNNQLESKIAIEKNKNAQKNKKINNQEEFGQEQNFNEFNQNKNVVSERTAWH